MVTYYGGIYLILRLYHKEMSTCAIRVVVVVVVVGVINCYLGGWGCRNLL